MPRIVDHEQRRRQIARAFQRLLAADGLGATSFTRVAAEAGTSVGLIQHYFASRDDLLHFAYEDCLYAMEQRLDARIRAGEEAGRPIAETLRTCLTELLPLDDERTVEYRVRLSLLTEAHANARLADVARATSAHLHQRVSTAVENGKLCGEVQPEVDSPAAASMVVAATQGLAESLGLAGPGAAPGSPDPVLQPVLSLVFTGRCRHYD